MLFCILSPALIFPTKSIQDNNIPYPNNVPMYSIRAITSMNHILYNTIQYCTSPAETPECWNLQFQTEAILADNFSKSADCLDNKGNLSVNQGKMSANKADVWNCRVQRSRVSAGLMYTVRGNNLGYKVVKCTTYNCIIIDDNINYRQDRIVKFIFDDV